MSAPHRHYRINANLFGIPLGLCGLAQCWTIAGNFNVTPQWPSDALWVVATLVWAVIAIVFVAQRHRAGDLGHALAEPTFGPFVPVAAIVPMLLGGALARHAPTAGHIVFWIALVATLLLGGWLIGQWTTAAPPFAQWHFGYFLPTVGGGLVGSIVATSVGQRSLGQLLFGYGVISWFVLAPIIRIRLFTQPALPVPLRSTLAIEIAPPVIAGLAWFQLNGNQADMVAYFFAGYAVLIAIVQVRLLPLYRQIPFGPAWWAFSFPYAAAAGYLIRWTAAEGAAPAAWTWLLLIITTLAVAVLLVRTAAALVARRFLPTSAGQQSSPDPRPDQPTLLARVG